MKQWHVTIHVAFTRLGELMELARHFGSYAAAFGPSVLVTGVTPNFFPPTDSDAGLIFTLKISAPTAEIARRSAHAPLAKILDKRDCRPYLFTKTTVRGVAESTNDSVRMRRLEPSEVTEHHYQVINQVLRRLEHSQGWFLSDWTEMRVMLGPLMIELMMSTDQTKIVSIINLSQHSSKNVILNDLMLSLEHEILTLALAEPEPETEH
jgi:hypothetical protein